MGSLDSGSRDWNPYSCRTMMTMTTMSAGVLTGLHAGSPFSTWASSASQLKVTGPGIEHGVLSTFKSVFEVDATDAGPGDLKVRVGGRRGQLWSDYIATDPGIARGRTMASTKRYSLYKVLGLSPQRGPEVQPKYESICLFLDKRGPKLRI